MQTVRPSLFARSDTMLGVCEALGTDFGFNANYLRVALGLLVIWNLGYAVAAYLGLGVLVATCHFVYPSPRATVAEETDAALAEAAPAEAAGEQADANVQAENDEGDLILMAAAA